MSERHETNEFDDDFGREIAAVLEPYKPDAEQFAREVQQQLEATETARVIPLPAFVRRVAAILPPIVVPLALTRAGVAATAVASKKLGWKVLPTAIALPAAVLAMLFVTFFVTVRRAVVANAHAEQAHLAQHAVSAWWRERWRSTLVVGALIAFVAFEAPIEAVMIVLGVSMLCLVGIVGALARNGFATRREIGGRCTYALGFIALMGSQFSDVAAQVADVERDSIFAGMLVLASGALIVAALSMFRTDAPRRRRGVQPGIGGVWFALFTLVFVCGERYWLGQREVTTEVAVQALERATPRWDFDADEIEGAVIHLRAAGVALSDLDAVAESFRAYLDAEFAAGREVSPYDAAAIERLGFFRESDYEAFRDDTFAKFTIHGDMGLHFLQQAAFRIAIHDRLESLTEQQRSSLAQRAVEQLDDLHAHDVLKNVVTVIQILERVGHEDRVETVRDFARDALLATWAAAPGDWAGCFAPGYASIDRDEDGVPDEPSHTFVWLPANDMAMRLLARFGVPDGIDLEALDRYLTEQSRHYGRTPDGRHVLAAAIRSHLHATPEWQALPSPSAWQKLVDMRLLFGAGLMVLFCVVVTSRAPRQLAAARWSGSSNPAAP